MTGRLHFFRSGLKLAGVLYLPAGEPPVDGWPALVFCHGFTAVKPPPKRAARHTVTPSSAKTCATARPIPMLPPVTRAEVLEPVELVEGARVLVTVLPDEETGFWMDASHPALDAVCGNTEDDIYARLLEA